MQQAGHIERGRQLRPLPSITTCLLISLLLHVVFFFLINRPQPKNEEPLALTVSYEPPSVLKQKPQSQRQTPQIVSPPIQQSKNLDDQNIPFLSDKDSQAEHQQIKRGVDPNAGPVVAKQQSEVPQPGPDSKPQKPIPPSLTQNKDSKAEPPRAKAAQRETKPEQNQAAQGKVPELKDLVLDDASLLAKFGNPTKQGKPSEDRKETGVRSLNAYRAFSRPSGSGAAFIGNSGSSDYLPNLPDGDMTLLNTKADQFAVFVRRVATNVFMQIRSSGWELMRHEEMQQIADYSTVIAILSPQGKLLSVTIDSSSGSSRFDHVLLAAAQQGSHDPNPPQGALASDGNIHFVFKARSWSEIAQSARSGAPFEKRWLVLATGLE